MKEPTLIDVQADINEFFREAIEAVVRSRGYETTNATQCYVATLLADYARPEALSGDVFRRPFTLLLHDALETAGPDRFERLRSLGDQVLYISSFFGDHLEHRGVELDYVSDLGSRAYDYAAAMLRRGTGGSRGPDVLGELASNFRSFVELLSDVADGLFARAARGDREVLSLFERWQRTRSSALAEALISWGLVPTTGDGTLH